MGNNIAGHNQALDDRRAQRPSGTSACRRRTDDLTGLDDRRYFTQRLGEEVARATQIGHPLALLFCDLDHVKGYDDRLGLTAGDRALRAVSGMLLRAVRQVDLAARHEDERLTVILMDTTPDGAPQVTERIRAAAAGLDPGGPDRGLTVSVSVATFPDDAALIEELVEKAGWAMHLAKRQGATAGCRAERAPTNRPAGRRR